MPYETPTSDKLASHDRNKAQTKALAAASTAELLRLTNLTRTDGVAATVINRTKPATHATIEVWGDPSTNRSTDESTRNAARDTDRDAILSGQPLAEQTDVKMLLAQEHRRRGAIEDALESIERDIRTEKARLAVQYSKELKPSYDDEMRILFKALVDAHASHVRLNTLRQHLVDSGLGFREGVMQLMPDAFLSHPLNKYSELAAFLHEGKRLGFTKVPKELQ
jgi:hypothetical protein